MENKEKTQKNENSTLSRAMPERWAATKEDALPAVYLPQSAPVPRILKLHTRIKAREEIERRAHKRLSGLLRYGAIHCGWLTRKRDHHPCRPQRAPAKQWSRGQAKNLANESPRQHFGSHRAAENWNKKCFWVACVKVTLKYAPAAKHNSPRPRAPARVCGFANNYSFIALPAA